MYEQGQWKMKRNATEDINPSPTKSARVDHNIMWDRYAVYGMFERLAGKKVCDRIVELIKNPQAISRSYANDNYRISLTNVDLFYSTACPIYRSHKHLDVCPVIESIDIDWFMDALTDTEFEIIFIDPIREKLAGDDLIRACEGVVHTTGHSFKDDHPLPQDITLKSTDGCTAVIHKHVAVVNGALLHRSITSEDFQPSTVFDLPCKERTLGWLVASMYIGEYRISDAIDAIEAIATLEYLMIVTRANVEARIKAALL